MRLLRPAGRRNSHRSGLSLVEVLIAVSVLVLVVFTFMRLISGTDTRTWRLGHLAKATRMVQQLVEECQNRPISDYFLVFGKDQAVGPLEVDPGLFPNTEASIVAFQDENKTSLQFFSRTVRARAVRNALNQIREVWLEAEIRWTEKKPQEGSASPTERLLRAGGVLCDLEAR